jgi:hypothetical protein
MSAPLTLSITVDQEEYSRFESERNTVISTITPTGTNLTNEQISVTLIKARRNRDELVATKTFTIPASLAQAYQLEFYLPDIVDEEAVSKVRRGNYFLRATSVSNPNLTADSEDFRVSLVSVERLKTDFMFGAHGLAADVLTVQEQPSAVSGTVVSSVSQGHPTGWYPLSYNFAGDHVPTVLGVTSQTFALSNGQTLILRLDNGDPLTVTFLTSQFVSISAATALEVAAVISSSLSSYGVTSVAESNKVRITGGLISLLIDPAGTATTTLGLLGKFDVANITRFLTWCGGPAVVLTEGKKTYTLRQGNTNNCIQVRVPALSLMPAQSRAEDLLIAKKPLDTETMRRAIDESISWLEDSALSVFIEPTVITTEVDPDVLAYPIDSDIPQLINATWDVVVDSLAYYIPSAGHWINFKFPYIPIIRFDELYGKLSNTRILDVALEWVEAHEKSGFVELVPFNQETVFNFIGLMLMQSLQGQVPLPNFWNFTALVGHREVPPVLLELVAKKAAIQILTLAGMAYRPGITSSSIHRDGISESVSYIQSAQAGTYGMAVTEYKDWIDKNIVLLRGAFRGPNMIVV